MTAFATAPLAADFECVKAGKCPPRCATCNLKRIGCGYILSGLSPLFHPEFHRESPAPNRSGVNGEAESSVANVGAIQFDTETILSAVHPDIRRRETVHPIRRCATRPAGPV